MSGNEDIWAGDDHWEPGVRLSRDRPRCRELVLPHSWWAIRGTAFRGGDARSLFTWPQQLVGSRRKALATAVGYSSVISQSPKSPGPGEAVSVPRPPPRESIEVSWRLVTVRLKVLSSDQSVSRASMA